MLRVFFFLKWLESKKSINELSLFDLKKYVARIKNERTRHGVKASLKVFIKFLIELYDELNIGIEKKRLEEIYRYFKLTGVKSKLPTFPSNLNDIVERLIAGANQPYKSILALIYKGKRCAG